MIDTGIGISSEDFARLFKVFSQLDSSTTRKFGGTGLGLAISRNIIETLGGVIECQSQPGEGSCFKVIIPYEACGKRDDGDMCIGTVGGKAYKVVLFGLSFRSEQVIASYLNYWNCTILKPDMMGDADLMIADFRNASVNPKFGVEKPVIEVVGLTQQPIRQDSHVLHRPIHPKKLFLSIRNIIEGKSLAAPREEQAGANRLIGDQCPMRILVVEDNKVNQKVLRLMLRNLGYQAQVANHGGEVLSVLEQASVDLILMDLQMPVMDGITTAECIRGRLREDRRPWIVAQTASVMPEVREQVLQSGMNDLIPKPIIEADLRRAIRQAWNHMQQG